MANFHGKELVRKLKQNLPKMFSGLKREHTDLIFFFIRQTVFILSSVQLEV